MKTARLTGVLPPFLLVGAVLGAAWLWHGPPTRSTPDKPGLGAGEYVRPEVADPTVLVVDYQDDVNDAFLATTPEDEQPISRWSSADRLYRVRLPSAAAAAATVARLRSDPRVESVDWDVAASIPPDEQEQLDRAAAREAADQGALLAECAVTVKDGGGEAGAPSDPCYRYQWHLRQLGIPSAWALGKGEGAVVAVIDTGVSRVPDLAGTKFVPGYNFVGDNDDASDDHGHGTHVAGTIAQTTHNKLGVGGVAFKASIMPLKVLSANGSGSMAAIAQAIRFAADNGAHVINMSLGGRFPVGAIGSAVKYARGKGVTVVAAAGNDGSGRVSYPARYPGVIAVAATQFDETTTFYSNWGPQIDIAGPGGNVRVDQNGDGQPDGVLQNTVVPRNTSSTDYLWFMGTSMASPHVAGVAALVVGAGVTKPDAVEQVLLDTARKPKGKQSASGARVDDHFGAGLVDAHAALTKVRGARGAGELGLGAALALVGLSFLARRGKASGKVGPGFVAALLAGSSGLFFLPLVMSWLGSGMTAGVTSALSSGVLDGADGILGRAFGGNPLLWSALLPVGLTALLYGVARLRPALAGLGFGVAGALLFAAVAGAFDVRYVPNVLDRAWLVANAALAALVATNVLRR
jgi:serine protease